jgi:hypothetical protein
MWSAEPGSAVAFYQYRRDPGRDQDRGDRPGASAYPGLHLSCRFAGGRADADV